MRWMWGIQVILSGYSKCFLIILKVYQTIISAYTITDEETKQAIREVYRDKKYLLDPHGAVAYLALQRYLSANHSQSGIKQSGSSHSGINQSGIFLETAHPVKFYDVVEPVIDSKIDLPPAILKIADKEKKAIKLEAEYSKFREYLLSL